MGTRNITRVIVNNQLKVCQYCQWDGYPTAAGNSIADFIRESDDDHMIERLGHVTLVPNVKGDTFSTGAPLFAEADSIAHDEFYFREVPDKEARKNHPEFTAFQQYEYINRRVDEMLVEKYGPELMQLWHISNRDTGWKILPLIYDSTQDLTVYSDDSLIDNFGDWEIEGVWEVDYDTKTLTGWWLGKKASWTFRELRDMDDNELSDVMDAYEKIGWED